ncbi:MAG: radical SAM protein, partial [Acidobacteria bacterium]|nr:radical SAM protein [Acidobacteriota bacterium]
EGLKDVYKGFNLAGDALVDRLQQFREHGVHVLGSFIFGLPSDRPDSFEATAALAHAADIDFAQFLTLTPFPGTVDFLKWEKTEAKELPDVDGVPVSRYWLIPPIKRPKIFSPHPAMSAEEIRVGTQRAWDRFYSLSKVWRRSRCVRSMRYRLAFMLVSKLYRQMYGNTGIATDSARVSRSAAWARWLAIPLKRLFSAAPLPELQVPAR